MSGLGIACPSSHVFTSLSAQGLQCYECYGVPIETSCPAVTCRASDGFCIAQNIELIEGKFPVTYIKMAEEGFGENIMSVHLLWTKFPIPPSRVFLGLEWDSCNVGNVGVQGCAGMWIIKQG